MCRVAFASLFLTLAVAPGVLAVDRRVGQPEPQQPPVSVGEVQMTPEMWFYEQELRQYNDPKYMVRRKAEYRSAQRAARLAAQQWYGVSNARPNVACTPFSGGNYGPTFGGSHDQNLWPSFTTPVEVRRAAAAGSTVIVR